MTRSFAARVPLQQLTGLRPSAWVCVGAGFAREDFKALALARGQGLTGEAITDLQAICARVLAADRAADPSGPGAPRLLSPLGRQEVLRLLLAEPRVSAGLPELKRLRRQGGFFKRLDLAVQGGRMAFAHEAEAEVHAERLQQRLGFANPVREEIRRLATAYETWLEACRLTDPPMLIRAATEVLAGKGWPAGLSRPEAVHVFSGRAEEAREAAFWDALGRHVRVVRVGTPGLPEAPAEVSAEAPAWDWQLWHTLDDAADELADEIGRCVEKEGEAAYDDLAVLIPDTSSARRSLRRALEARGIPLADPRDPNRLRWDEGIKWGTLPLETVARGFERGKAIAYLRAYQMGGEGGLSPANASNEFPRWVSEINMRGIRAGLWAYAGGNLSVAHSHLAELQDVMGGRRTCAELAEAHLKLLRAAVGADPTRLWIVPFFESVWKDFTRDTALVDPGARKAPPLYWWERLQARLAEVPAPVERARPRRGVAVYRLHQLPLQPRSRVWVLGLPAQWLSGDGAGDLWYPEREREVLGAEFAVRSSIQVRTERLAALKAWMGGGARVTVLDASYDVDGRERESVEALLREVAAGLPERTVPEKPSERGAHPRWSRSYGALRPLQSQEVQLAPLPRQPGAKPPEVTATALDAYSRCSMMALAYHRWKLRDVNEPEMELWPDARGNILHEAVKILLESRDADGAFAVSSEEALERAWKLQRPKGLVKSARAERYVKSRLLQTLDAFRDKEREYYSRAPSRIATLDDVTFRLDFDEVSVVGTPDRVDEHAEGVFVIDYKTSSSLPNGGEMVELGYRLQLPFYALAAAAQLGKPVLGVQFVELNRKGGRGNGIFFKRYNGKEPGKLTCLRANSKSLLSLEPEAAWAALAEQVREHARALVGGRFAARPKRKEKECSTCQVADFCGFRRLVEPAADEGEGA